MLNPVKAFTLGYTMKAAGVNDLPFPKMAGGWLTSRAKVDPRKVGDGMGNSAVVAVTTALGSAYLEPPIGEYVRVEGEWVRVDDSPAADLINNPNPHIETEMLWTYEVAAIASYGSAFYHIVRNGLGEPVQLWPLYPAFMSPHTPKDGSQFLSHWEYKIPGSYAPVKIPVTDVVQRRWKMDRNDHRKGEAPLKSILMEVLQDDEASMFSTSLLTNLGVPGVILSPTDPSDPGPSDPAAVAQMFKSKFGGTNRGEPFVSSNSLKVDMVSFSPEQMDLTALRRVPEERISAVLGWPAILSNLGAGLTSTSGTGEAGTLRENATESTLVPMWRLAGKQWTRQLLYDDAYGGADPSKQLRFDLSQVRSLQGDEDKLVARMDVAVKGGWATVAEGRRAIGLDVEPQHEVFLRNISTMAVGVDEDATLDNVDSV